MPRKSTRRPTPQRMRALARAYPRDADIATLAAESLLNLHPYDWWAKDGSARPWTARDPRAARARARARARAPRRQPLLDPPDGVLAASGSRRGRAPKRSARLVPGSGHLLHMPAHIDMRTGRYADAIAANERAIAADERYVAQVDAQGAYRVGYVAHNRHFLWAAAAMDGRSALALAAARAAYPSACGPGRSDRSTGILQHYYVLPLYALVRFGRWREILEDTLPPDVNEPYPLAIWHYARGTAFARTGRAGRGAPRARRPSSATPPIPRSQHARIKNINAGGRTRAHRDADAWRRHCRGRGATPTRPWRCSSRRRPSRTRSPTTSRICGSRRRGTRSAPRCWRRDAPRTRSASTARTSRHYPENGWSLAGLAEAQRRQGHGDAARDAERTVARSHGATPTSRCPARASSLAPPGPRQRRAIARAADTIASCGRHQPRLRATACRPRAALRTCLRRHARASAALRQSAARRATRRRLRRMARNLALAQTTIPPSPAL